MTKEQLADIRRRAERDSGAWTGIVGEAIYDRRKLLTELDRLSRIEDKYVNLCPVLNEQAGEIKLLQGLLSELLPYHMDQPRGFVELDGNTENDWVRRARSALEPVSEHHVMDSIDG